MAPVPTFVDVTFRDDANTTRTIRYRLLAAAEDDGSNMAAVLTAAAAVETALNALTNDHIDYYDIVIRDGGGGAAADDNSNNQLTAFIRTTLSDNDAGDIQVPSWDSDAYDINTQLMLDAAFLTAADTLANLLVDIDSGLTMDAVEWAQSRTRKLRGKRIG
jgi:hypothetical protein